jgi:signal transduction histidine kinase/integral membrane sensor domain MASE1
MPLRTVKPDASVTPSASAARWPPARLAAAAALTALAYYGGVQVGLALTFPPLTTSVLWPPNALLTAALLLVPVRYWWVCLGAALPVHLTLELGAGFSPALTVLLFLTNCSEAVIAAGGVRWLSDAPTEFNTFQRIAAFIGAAGFLAPIVSSFADAAVVHLVRGEPYWSVWQFRTFGNSLTELSVVPCAVLIVEALRRGVRQPRPSRLAEGLALTLCVGLVADRVFGGAVMVPGLPNTPSVLLLPFLFWAVRFGLGGVSAALLLCALMASYETGQGHRPFASLPPLESLLAVQMYLTVMGVPLMCLAGLLDERRRTAADLAERLRFEGLIASVAGALVRAPANTELSSYDDGLRRIGEFLDVDCVGLLKVGDGPGNDITREWRPADVMGLEGVSILREFPWVAGRVLAGEMVTVRSERDLPAGATVDRHAFLGYALTSVVVVPLVAGGRVLGALSSITRRRRDWHESDLAHLRLVGEVLANAGARRRAELELQRTRLELAQVARRSSMGELTASLAHQLNQPLAGIRNNAEAARRYLDARQPPLDELRATIADIVDDNRRAGDVIRRVRDMMSGTSMAPAPLDANVVVDNVATLIASDAVLRNIAVTFDIAPWPLTVVGHRTDLEQVLLNVVTNAMDAVADCPSPQRAVVVRTTRDAAGHVVISVRDRGPGLAAGTERQIFEPFFTRKAAGMGMGLTVARSLVDQHGGTITATNHPEGGLEVTIAIPPAREAA